MTDVKTGMNSGSILKDAGLSHIIRWYRFYGFNLDPYETVKNHNKIVEQKNITKSIYYYKSKIILFALSIILFSVVTFGIEIQSYTTSKLDPAQVSMMVVVYTCLICNTFNYLYIFATVINASRFLHHLSSTILNMDIENYSPSKSFSKLCTSRCFKMSLIIAVVLISDIAGSISSIIDAVPFFKEQFGNNSFAAAAIGVISFLILIHQIYLFSITTFLNVSIITIYSLLNSIIQFQIANYKKPNHIKKREKPFRSVANHQLQHLQMSALVKHADECYAQHMLSLIVIEVVTIIFYSKGTKWEILNPTTQMYTAYISLKCVLYFAIKAYFGSNVNSSVSKTFNMLTNYNNI
ncbi:hypothetical protein CHUAL_003564 [Chamberlinius hualienensis]